MWRYGGGDWTLPWRVYHGLGPDWRPLADPDGDAKPIGDVARYRNFVYGMAHAAAVMEEGVRDKSGPARPKRRRDRRDDGKPREQVSEGGVVLPTGAAKPPR